MDGLGIGKTVNRYASHKDDKLSKFRRYHLTCCLILSFNDAVCYYIWVDINECDSNNGGCEQICVNKRGALNVCGCRRGYTQDPLESFKCRGRKDAYLLWHTFKKLLLIPPKQKYFKNTIIL